MFQNGFINRFTILFACIFLSHSLSCGWGTAQAPNREAGNSPKQDLDLHPSQHDSSEVETRGPKLGQLILHGGGSDDGLDPSISTVLNLARRRIDANQELNIVVIPTAKPDWKNTEKQKAGLREKAKESLEASGEFQLTILHTRKRSEAESEAFCRPLKSAHLVVILGGYQRLLKRTYVGTRFQEELWNVLDRGNTIAGSSAGAIIQGTHFSRTPIGSKGFGFLTHSVVDVHVSERGREDHLIDGFNRGKFDSKKQLGIGLDETMIAVITQDTLEVYGEMSVFVVNPREWTDEKPPFYHELSDGDRYDLRNRKVLPPLGNR